METWIDKQTENTHANSNSNEQKEEEEKKQYILWKVRGKQWMKWSHNGKGKKWEKRKVKNSVPNWVARDQNMDAL